MITLILKCLDNSLGFYPGEGGNVNQTPHEHSWMVYPHACSVESEFLGQMYLAL